VAEFGDERGEPGPICGGQVLTPGVMALAAVLLVYAALHDVAARTVPNWLPLCLLVLGCGARLADHSLLAGAAVGLITFVALLGLWLGGAMGGGDVKLWAATALLIPPLLQPELAFLLRVLLCGGVLAIFYLLLRFCVPRPRGPRQGGLLRRIVRAEAWRIGRRAPLPYACAIAGGALSTLLPLSFGVR
jgi:prepilin peptidase CpaA